MKQPQVPPSEGGTYLRQPDGSLQRLDDAVEPISPPPAAVDAEPIPPPSSTKGAK